MRREGGQAPMAQRSERPDGQGRRIRRSAACRGGVGEASTPSLAPPPTAHHPKLRSTLTLTRRRVGRRCAGNTKPQQGEENVEVVHTGGGETHAQTHTQRRRAIARAIENTDAGTLIARRCARRSRQVHVSKGWKRAAPLAADDKNIGKKRRRRRVGHRRPRPSGTRRGREGRKGGSAEKWEREAGRTACACTRKKDQNARRTR